MTVYEHDDQGLRVIGYNQGVFFYDPTRTLRAEIYLKPDNTLNLGGVYGGGGSTPGSTSPHTLGDTVTHLGVLLDNQAPQFLMRDGSRVLTAPWNAGQPITLPNTGLHLLDTDASHDLIIAPGSDLTADRTLTITTGDADRTLTLANSGTAVVGTGTATRLAEWSDANTIAASTLIKTGAGVLTLDAAGAVTLTVPESLTAAGRDVGNTFTAIQKINVNSTTAFVVEQDGVKDNVVVVDTTNARVGVNCQPGAYALDVNTSVRCRAGFIIKNSGTYGSVSTVTGNGTRSGYFQWNLPSADGSLGTRLAYMGYDLTNLTITLENGAHFVVSGGSVLVGTVTNSGKLAVDQASTTGALPVLWARQRDLSEPMMWLVSESAADDSQTFIDAADMTTPGALIGWFRVYVEDLAASGAIPSGVYVVPLYELPTA